MNKYKECYAVCNRLIEKKVKVYDIYFELGMSLKLKICSVDEIKCFVWLFLCALLESLFSRPIALLSLH